MNIDYFLFLESDEDVKAMKEYENLFTVNPPGRQFKERMNERVSAT